MSDGTDNSVKWLCIMYTVVFSVLLVGKTIEYYINAQNDRTAIEAGLEQREVDGEVLWVKTK